MSSRERLSLYDIFRESLSCLNGWEIYILKWSKYILYINEMRERSCLKEAVIEKINLKCRSWNSEEKPAVKRKCISMQIFIIQCPSYILFNEKAEKKHEENKKQTLWQVAEISWYNPPLKLFYEEAHGLAPGSLLRRKPSASWRLAGWLLAKLQYTVKQLVESAWRKAVQWRRFTG